MVKYRILKNAPPVARPGNNHYPFAAMKIGDAFDAPAAEEFRVRPAASYFAKRHPGFKFSVHRHSDGVRVWRVAIKKD